MSIYLSPKTKLQLHGKMNFYFCDPCDKSFTGIRPYEAHLESEKHKKKVNKSTPPVMVDLTTPVPQTIGTSTASTKVDPFIITDNGINFRCTCCSIDLNSTEQAKSHASGAKHAKQARNMDNQFSSGVSKIDSPKDRSTETLEMDITNSNITFSFHGIKIENVLKELKIFGVNDPIVF